MGKGRGISTPPLFLFIYHFYRHNKNIERERMKRSEPKLKCDHCRAELEPCDVYHVEGDPGTYCEGCGEDVVDCARAMETDDIFAAMDYPN